MGKQKQTRKFAVAKKIISSKDARMLVDHYILISLLIVNHLQYHKSRETDRVG